MSFAVYSEVTPLPISLHADIYGLMIDSDYSSCSPTAARRLGAPAVEAGAVGATVHHGAGAGASNAEIRAAKRVGRRRQKEAKQASKGLNSKLKKVKKVKKIGGMVVKKGARKWAHEQTKRARLHAWQDKKRMRQQHKGLGAGHGKIGGGLATVGHQGLLAATSTMGSSINEEEEAAAAETVGVRVGTINAALSAGAGAGGDKGYAGYGRRVRDVRGMKRLAFKAARGAVKKMKRGSKAMHSKKAVE